MLPGRGMKFRTVPLRVIILSVWLPGNINAGQLDHGLPLKTDGIIRVVKY